MENKDDLTKENLKEDIINLFKFISITTVMNIFQLVVLYLGYKYMWDVIGESVKLYTSTERGFVIISIILFSIPIYIIIGIVFLYIVKASIQLIKILNIK